MVSFAIRAGQPGRRHQHHRLPQPAGIQRHQVLPGHGRPGARRRSPTPIEAWANRLAPRGRQDPAPGPGPGPGPDHRPRPPGELFQASQDPGGHRGPAPGRPQGGGGRALRHRPGLSGRLPAGRGGGGGSPPRLPGRPTSAGHRPEPSAEFLAELAARIPAGQAHLGLAVDADADRFGVMDATGDYHEANEILALLLDYLIETRGWEGGVARSVATTHLIDRVAALYGRPVYRNQGGVQVPGGIHPERPGRHGGGRERRLLHESTTCRRRTASWPASWWRKWWPGRARACPSSCRNSSPGWARFTTAASTCRLAPEAKERLLARLKTHAGHALPASRWLQHVTLDGHKYHPGRRQLGLLPALGHRAGGALLPGGLLPRGAGAPAAQAGRPLLQETLRRCPD